MELRHLSERYENEFLAPYATRCSDSKGRKVFEEKDINRTCFQRDRDRIFFSRSFRKLQHKTQVFIIQEGQSYRNRYIHTMQVALHARMIARFLKANEDLCEAIAYAHDVGHPPFGHAGEKEICLISKEKGGFDFEHNIQSLRVVHFLEKRNGMDGLNLCFETLEGIVRHQTISDKPKDIPDEFLQYKAPSIEAQIVNVADEIAFSIHDLYDAYKAKLFPKVQIEELRKISLWKESNERFGLLTHILINDVLENSLEALSKIKSIEELRNNDVICTISAKTIEKLRELQKFLFRYVYKSPAVTIMDNKGRKIIRNLFNEFWKKPELLPVNFLNKLENEDKTRVIIDFLAGLSDIEANNLHKSHCDLYKELII